MDWIALQVNLINQSEIPEKYRALMMNNATFMEYIGHNRSNFHRLFGVLQAAQQPQSVSVAAAAPVASAKQEAADRLVQLIKGLTIDDSTRQQAMTDIATLMSSSTNGGSRKRRSIKPKKTRKTKYRKTKSRRH